MTTAENPSFEVSTAPEIYPVSKIGLGQLTMMPKPRAESLSSDIAFYKAAGITHIVSLLVEEEVIKLKLSEEAEIAKSAGLKFLHFPVKDMNVPSFKALHQLNHQLMALLDDGAHIAVHCHGGRGRAGTLVVSLMMESGLQLQDALTIARRQRGDIVPVCELQETFLANYAEQINRED